jgi:3-oxoacyl-[acyl-carrier-protein] synthase II
MNRVVVTAVAAITPLGNDSDSSWENLLAGKSGIAKVASFDATGHDTQIAGEVKGFEPTKYINAKAARRMEKFAQYAVSASKMLMERAGYSIPAEEAHRAGVILGVAWAGGRHRTPAPKAHRGRSGGISPFFIPTIIANMAAGMVLHRAWRARHQHLHHHGLRLRHTRHRRRVSRKSSWAGTT